MKKVFIILIVLSLGAVGLVAEGLETLPSYIVLNDGVGATYNCTLMTMTVAGVNIYSIDVLPQGSGLLFVDLVDGKFHIVVFADSYWAAYTQVGYIDKPCATAYNANSHGGMFEVTICMGATSDSSESPNSNRK